MSRSRNSITWNMIGSFVGRSVSSFLFGCSCSASTNANCVIQVQELKYLHHLKDFFFFCNMDPWFILNQCCSHQPIVYSNKKNNIFEVSSQIIFNQQRRQQEKLTLDISRLCTLPNAYSLLNLALHYWLHRALPLVSCDPLTQFATWREIAATIRYQSCSNHLY